MTRRPRIAYAIRPRSALSKICRSTLPAMARRGWTRSIFPALLAAAGAAATQLGLAYGLDIVVWIVPTNAAGPGGATWPGGPWSAGLVWTTWIAAMSVVLGTLVGSKLGGHPGDEIGPSRLVRGARRLAITLAAAFGSLVVVPLAAVSARNVTAVASDAPHLVTGVYAALGVGLGLVVSLFALASRAVAVNVLTTFGWLWLLAIGATIHGLGTRRGFGYSPLAVWEFTADGPYWRSYHVPSALLILVAALLIGGLTALVIARRGAGGVGATLSGAAGPLVVAVAYTVANRYLTVSSVDGQISAYFLSPYVVIAGLAGSVLATTLLDRLATANTAGSRSAPRTAPEPATLAEPVVVPEQAARLDRVSTTV